MTTNMIFRRGLAASIFLPWILDFFSGQAVMASVGGALLWGLGVLVLVIRQSIKDPILRKKLTFFLASITGAWLCLWTLSVSGGLSLSWSGSGLRALTVAHASLLAAGFGMVLMLGVTSIFWIIKQRGLSSKSPTRFLPSLESLSKAAQISSRAAFWSWASGLFFAVLTALIRWQRVHVDEHALFSLFRYQWLSDPKVLLSMALLLPLVFCRVIRWNWSSFERPRYYGFTLSSLLFVFLFFVLFSMDGEGTRHEALRWFAR